MNLNNDVVYRRLRLGPLHQLHPGRSRSLIRHHNRLHRSPPCVEFLPARLPLQPLSQDGLSDRNGLIKISAAPASMRNAEWPCHVSFIGIISLVICLCWKCKLSSQLFTCTFHQLGLLTLQRCLRIRALGSPWIVSSHPHNDWWYTRASL